MSADEVVNALRSIQAEVQHKNTDNAWWELERLIKALELEGIGDDDDFDA